MFSRESGWNCMGWLDSDRSIPCLVSVVAQLYISLLQSLFTPIIMYPTKYETGEHGSNNDWKTHPSKMMTLTSKAIDRAILEVLCKKHSLRLPLPAHKPWFAFVSCTALLDDCTYHTEHFRTHPCSSPSCSLP